MPKSTSATRWKNRSKKPFICTVTSSTTCWLRRPQTTTLPMQWSTSQTSHSRPVHCMFYMHWHFGTSRYIVVQCTRTPHGREFYNRPSWVDTFVNASSICLEQVLANERASLNVELSSSGSDMNMGNNAKEVFTINPRSSLPLTFPPSTDSSILGSGPYCWICLQAIHVLSACLLIKIPDEINEIPTEGVKQMYRPMPNSRCRSKKWSVSWNSYNHLAQHGWNPSTLSTKQPYKHHRIRYGSDPSNAVSRSDRQRK